MLGLRTGRRGGLLMQDVKPSERRGSEMGVAIEEIELLATVPDETPAWTREIARAAGCAHMVGVCGIRLRILLKAGLVEKVVAGGPAQGSTWRRTEQGRAALRAHRPR